MLKPKDYRQLCGGNGSDGIFPLRYYFSAESTHERTLSKSSVLAAGNVLLKKSASTIYCLAIRYVITTRFTTVDS